MTIKSTSKVNPKSSYRVLSQPLYELMEDLEKLLQANEELKVFVPKPPVDLTHYEGELYKHAEYTVRFRSLRAWIEITQILDVLCTIESVTSLWYEFKLFKRNDSSQTWHHQALKSGHPEKYGMGSEYSRISKLEEPRQLDDLYKVARSIKKTSIAKGIAIGCNQGDELLGLWRGLGHQQQESIQGFIGLDHSESAIKAAQAKYSPAQYPKFKFEVADANALEIGRYGNLDLLMALNILHSPALDGHQLIKNWVKTLLNRQATVIIGLPNCRYQGSKLRFGAVTKHRGEHQDMSLVMSEVQFYSRYLRQQGFNVQIMGHYTLMIIGQR